MQLASTLQGIVTQTLLPTADGAGRVPCLEILYPDDAVRNLIRQGKVEQIYSVMQTSTQRGMQTMEHGLVELLRKRVVTVESALGGLEPEGTARRDAGTERDRRGSPGARGAEQRRRSGWRGARDGAPQTQGARRAAQPKEAKRAKKLVGLKIGASQIAAARVVNNGYARARRGSFGSRSSPASSCRRRDPRSERPRQRALTLLRVAQAPEEGRPPRDLQQPDRRPRLRARRDHRRTPARERGSLPRRGSAPDPARRSGPRLGRPRGSSARRRHVDSPDPPRRRLPGSRRSLPASVSRSGPRSRRDRPRGVRAPPLAVGSERPAHRRRCARRGRGRSRPDDDRGLHRAALRVHARPRLGWLVAQRRARARARHGAERGRVHQASALVRGGGRGRGPHARAELRRHTRESSALSPHSPRAGRRRCTSTRLSRERPRSERSSSPAAPRTCPVSPRR